MLTLLDALPTGIKTTVALVAVGGAATFAAESRYMTVADFTKSYVLNLKSEIRDIRKELRDADLSEREREVLEDLLDELIDELCYEMPNDNLCERET